MTMLPLSLLSCGFRQDDRKVSGDESYFLGLSSRLVSPARCCCEGFWAATHLPFHSPSSMSLEEHWVSMDCVRDYADRDLEESAVKHLCEDAHTKKWVRGAPYLKERQSQ